MHDGVPVFQSTYLPKCGAGGKKFFYFEKKYSTWIVSAAIAAPPFSFTHVMGVGDAAGSLPKGDGWLAHGKSQQQPSYGTRSTCDCPSKVGHKKAKAKMQKKKVAPHWQPSDNGDSILRRAAAARKVAARAAATAAAKLTAASGYHVQAHAALPISANNRLVLLVKLAVTVHGADYSHAQTHFAHAVASCAMLSADRVQLGSYYNAAQQATQFGAALSIAEDYCTANGNLYCYPAATSASRNKVLFATRVWSSAFSQCLLSTLRTTEKISTLAFAGTGANGPTLSVSAPRISQQWQPPKFSAAEAVRVAAAKKQQAAAAGVIDGLSVQDLVLLVGILVLWFAMAYYFHFRHQSGETAAPTTPPPKKMFAKSSATGARAKAAKSAASRLDDGISNAKIEPREGHHMRGDPTKRVVSYGGYGVDADGAENGEDSGTVFAKSTTTNMGSSSSYGYQQDETCLGDDGSDDDLV
jgi:hypothetical protein